MPSLALLFTALAAESAAGDSALAQGQWADAVKHYQTVGQRGVTELGPAIDKSSGGAPSTTSLTHAAWATNAGLAAAPGGSAATQDSAQSAHDQAAAIVGLLQKAAASLSSGPQAPPARVPHGGSSGRAPAMAPSPFLTPPVLPPDASPPPPAGAAASASAAATVVLPAVMGAVAGALLGLGPPGLLLGAVAGGLLGHQYPDKFDFLSKIGRPS